MQPTPHSGYHWDRTDRPFFEGWYYRLSLPELAQAFAFMVAIQDPTGGSPHSGGSLQILDSKSQHQWRTFPQVKGFWADPSQLALGHWGETRSLGDYLTPQYLDPDLFFGSVASGYQMTAQLNQGAFVNPASQERIRWHYQIEPIYRYGLPDPVATMGLFSYLSVFEPGWQILMAHGLATGWIEWNGQRYDFTEAPAYAEKNWGGSFPSRWFWLNANTFDDEADLTLTCAGAKRGVLWWQEEVAMISLHWQHQFLEWLPKNSQTTWHIDPWGSWQVQATSDQHHVQLTATTSDPGTWVFTPTQTGMQRLCRDTLAGRIRIQLWRREGQVWVLDLDASTTTGGAEIGGAPWAELWIGAC